MFGLTKREQLWKAEQQAMDSLVSLLKTALEAAAVIRVAELAQEKLPSTPAAGEETKKC